MQTVCYVEHIWQTWMSIKLAIQCRFAWRSHANVKSLSCRHVTVLSSAQDFESFLPSRPCTARWGDCGTPPTPSCGASLWLVPYPSTSPPTLRSVLNFVEGPVVMIGCSRAEPALGSCNLMLRFHRKRQSVHYAEAKSGLKSICSFFSLSNCFNRLVAPLNQLQIKRHSLNWICLIRKQCTCLLRRKTFILSIATWVAVVQRRSSLIT